MELLFKIVWVLCIIAAISIGLMRSGYNMAVDDYERALKRANIKLVPHKSVIDGVVTTNWIEVVHLDK